MFSAPVPANCVEGIKYRADEHCGENQQVKRVDVGFDYQKIQHSAPPDILFNFLSASFFDLNGSA
jgi:hypothetical protein